MELGVSGLILIAENATFFDTNEQNGPSTRPSSSLVSRSALPVFVKTTCEKWFGAWYEPNDDSRQGEEVGIKEKELVLKRRSGY